MRQYVRIKFPVCFLISSADVIENSKTHKIYCGFLIGWVETESTWYVCAIWPTVPA
jgi:hypothetical protein